MCLSTNRLREKQENSHSQVSFLTLPQTPGKALGIILTKEVKDLYSENTKTLKKEIEHLCLQNITVSIVKSIYQQEIQRFDAIPIKI